MFGLFVDPYMQMQKKIPISTKVFGYNIIKVQFVIAVSIVLILVL
jgi:hypothetical protein